MIFGLSIYFIIMDFFVFSFAGWVYESTFVSVRDHKLVNRGFLVEPALPLYGFGAVLVYVLLRPFATIPTLLYLAGMVLATCIEYLTSWLLETLFHTKWWDYSKEPYNFKGRIALIPSMFWGILSLLMFDVLQPIATKIINAIPEDVGPILLLVFMTIMTVDTIYTVITTVNFQKQLEKLYQFRVELEGLLEGVINEESRLGNMEQRVKEFWDSRNYFLKKKPLIGNQRLLDAFPTMKYKPKNHSAIDVKEILMNIKTKTEGIKEQISRKQKEEEK